MKTLCLLIAVVASLFASLPSLAADDAAGDPGTVAEKFYAGYVAQVEANGKPEIKDTTATVVLVTFFGKEKHQVTARLVKVNGVWLLDSVK